MAFLCISIHLRAPLHTHPFNGPLSGTTQVSRYQKGKNQSGFYWSKRQWVAVASAVQVCTSLQSDNHASTPPLSFYRPDALPAAQPTASKHWRQLWMLCKWNITYLQCYTKYKKIKFKNLCRCESVTVAVELLSADQDRKQVYRRSRPLN